MDFVSAFVVPILKYFWSYVSMCLTCFGFGGILAGIAFWDSGFWPWPIVLLWFIPCGLSIMAAEPTRRRYMKWQRTNVDDR